MLKNRQEGLTTLHGIWVTIIVALFFLGYVRLIQTTGWIDLLPDTNFTLYFLCAIGGVLITFRVYQAWGQRLGTLSWIESFQLSAQQMLRIALLLLAAVFATKDTHISRLFLGTFLAFTGMILIFCNYLLPGLICRIVFKASSVPTLFIGSSSETRKLSNWISRKINLGVQAVGLLSDEKNPDPLPDIPHLGQINDLSRILAIIPVGQIIILQNYLTESQTRGIIDVSQRYGCRIRIYNNWEKDYEHPISIDHEGEYTFFTLQNEPLENPVNRSLKRAFDITFSLPVVAFVLPPLMVLVWFFQRRQAPGSLFYTQPRSGLTKNTFNIIKFRTMYDLDQTDHETARQTRNGDNRVYPFGRFLRRTSLDEIPQFVNVLLGDMSIAGPRPHLRQHDKEFARLMKTYQTRHFVKPGITGLAQCKGFRGEILEPSLLRERVRYDIFYINHWSFLLDIQIVLATIKQMLFPPKSAY